MPAKPFQARGDVHPIAENISIVQHDIADIDSDAKLHAAIFFEVIVRVRQFILDIDRALDCRQCAAERGKNAVAGGSANSALVLRDKAIAAKAWKNARGSSK